MPNQGLSPGKYKPKLKYAVVIKKKVGIM